ncbi:protein UPSTREAM OF FLC-like [Senna tora]|uniref:Protein UPSTREAM OF FLC-like n=1 Tax=Senna tora TaxID=362788 RepID=A0A834SX52_9FABA|nr:protein UPSTREAM OF FLC-like [Senna tora]
MLRLPFSQKIDSCEFQEKVSMEKKMLESELLSPERSRNRTDGAKANNKANELKVGVHVIYYLSRNGQLEHPHLMEVPLSSPHGILCLKDVINRLNSLRGHGMANSYSWSAKRSYKKGFVWQDLGENDLIYPCSGHDEYVLKGTQLMMETSSSSFRSYETASFSETNSSNDASTQTEEDNKGKERELIEEKKKKNDEVSSSYDYELADNVRDERVENNNNEHYSSGRMKASTVLMQLIRCGSSKRYLDCGYVRDER